MTANEEMKLRIVIPHWIKHNKEHAEEFQRWAKEAGIASVDIFSAASLMIQVNNSLKKGLQKLGGPLEHTQKTDD